MEMRPFGVHSVRTWFVITVLVVLFSACRGRGQMAEARQIPAPTTSMLSTATLAPSPSPSPTITFTPLPSPTPTLTATPDPYAGLTVDDLSARTYGGGSLQAEETLAINSYFTRTLISYPSDGLTIYGFQNTPVGSGPFPVVIAVHGYIEPAAYKTLDYTTSYADALTQAGFLVLHPNLRGYPPSDDGDNRFRVGMAADVLNLIALVKEQAGKPGPLEQARPDGIGLWGHSMGGGISTRVMVISPDVQAVVLYGAMSADDRQNYERIYTYFSNGARGWEELQTSEADFQRISPAFYLDRVSAAVSIHHGEADTEVPLAWSQDLCQKLENRIESLECFTYPGQPHTFYGEMDALFVQRMVDFFNRTLKHD